MIVVFGRYRWSPDRLGFRNSFCLTCDAPCRSTQVRTFDFGHVFLLPLLPLGPRTRWVCDACGAEPDKRVRTRMGFKILGLVLLGFAALSLWAQPVAPGEAGFYWTCRILLPALLIGAIVHLVRAKPDAKYADSLRAVAPAQDTNCRFCKTQLASSPNWHCPNCFVRRH
jgi:hypothetical protein